MNFTLSSIILLYFYICKFVFQSGSNVKIQFFSILCFTFFHKKTHLQLDVFFVLYNLSNNERKKFIIIISLNGSFYFLCVLTISLYIASRYPEAFWLFDFEFLVSHLRSPNLSSIIVCSLPFNISFILVYNFLVLNIFHPKNKLFQYLNIYHLYYISHQTKIQVFVISYIHSYNFSYYHL